MTVIGQSPTGARVKRLQRIEACDDNQVRLYRISSFAEEYQRQGFISLKVFSLFMMSDVSQRKAAFDVDTDGLLLFLFKVDSVSLGKA